MNGLRYIIELIDRFTGPSKRIRDSSRLLTDSMTQLTNRIDLANNRASITTGYQRLASSFGTLALTANNAFNNLDNAVSSLRRTAAIVSGIITVKKLVDSTISLQKTEELIKFSSGAEGANNLSFLTSMVEKFNLPLVKTRDSFATFVAGMKDSELAGESMRKIFEGVSVASRAMNLDAERTSSVLRALTTMMSKGRVSAEELTQELGEALPNSLGIFASSMKVSKSQLFKMMENGEVLAEDTLPAFGAKLIEVFGGQAAKMADSPSAQLDRLGNRFELLKEKIGSVILPTFLKIGNGLGEAFIYALPYIEIIASKISEFWATLQPFINGLKDIALAAYSIVAPFLEWIGTTAGFGEVFTGMSQAIGSLLSSIGRIARSVFVFLSPILELVAKLGGLLFNFVGKILIWAIETIATIFDKIGSFFDWFGQKLSILGQALGLINDKNVTLTVTEKINKPNSVAGSALGMLTSPAPNKPSGSQAAKSTQNTADSINQGGSRPIHINVKYEKVIDGGITIYATTIKEGVEDVRRIIEETLLRSLNGATQLAR